jgi:hypothetical protein
VVYPYEVAGELASEHAAEVAVARLTATFTTGCGLRGRIKREETRKAAHWKQPDV